MKRSLAGVAAAVVLLTAGAATAWINSVGTISARDAARQIQRAQGRVRIVMLYSVSCPHCRTMFPEFVDVATRARAEGVTTMTFATSDEPADVEQFLGSKRLPFSTAVIGPRQPGELGDALAPTGIDLGGRFGVPYVAVIDRDGTVIGQTSGSGSARRIESWLAEAGVETP